MALIKFIARSGLVFEKLAETPWQHAKSIVEVDDQVEFGRVDHPSARTLTLFTKTMPRNSQIIELAFKMPLVAKNNTSNACEKLSLK